ncbi:hypothetical protein SUGI_0954490 [Cryptomeria japonica]|uniref:uncharacterized protein LOC131051303 n=1 Tax=Cryptomeria japonica TaxID=3369 RepID=UPI002414981B|nr:uncharacterized protein LOC131051303 [Cryptomeria japonica]GLJ45345.1 hypothetical protein SUGI_0954490 [Cryptomeria japonica]
MDPNPQFHVGITVPQQRKQVNLSPLPLSSPSFRPSNHANLPFMSFDLGNTAFTSSSLHGAPPFVRTEEEPPLLDELGINTQLIIKKTTSILNPIKVKTELHEDAELSGPFIICMALGVCQLLSGKLQFGVILGWVCLASFFLYVVINMLAGRNGNLDLYRCFSFVGYCLLPLLIFSALRLIIPHTTRTSILIMAGVTVIWCTRTCTTLLLAFTPYADQQRSLVAYACCLIYILFSLLVVF